MARRTLVETIDTSMSKLRIETRDQLRTLFIDEAESSAIDLSDPTYTEFEYMQHIRAAVDATFPPATALRILHLGGAGCALARCFNAERPRSRQLAIEIDPELAMLSRSYFDLPTSPALRIRAQDARTTLDTNSGSWHVIVRDTFANGKVPAHLATREAYARAAQLLQPEGIYCVNIAGERGLGPLYREVQTANTEFPHLCAIADPAIFKNRRFGNIILLASRKELNIAHIDRALRMLAMPARLISEELLVRQASGERAVTDADIGWSMP
ncbi:spermidine synthase [Arcanobacterium phocae]|uniref:spermidine synthase n=1 Tax=Arcanobacterium phocae TaxID=131112 RepID=UPI001C0EEC03|nr:fused MFS/spermidine synthase [Arcanobacterium phocae]